MTNSNQPVLSNNQLVKSVFIAILIGAIVLIGAVLPAEYNIDPLGTGKLFGFSKLYNSSNQNYQGQAARSFEIIDLQKLGSPKSISKPVEVEALEFDKQYVLRSDTIQIKVPAGKGIEYKFKASKLGSVKYDWHTIDYAIVYSEFHGEVYEKNPPEEVFYESYTAANSNNIAGTFTAPFNGKHGWYFRNKNKGEVTVTLHLEGEYELLD